MEFGDVVACFGAIVTLLAVIVALFNEPLRELAKRAVRRRGGVEIVGISQIEQSCPKRSHLKTRFRITNEGWLSDIVKVYVTEILGRTDFIELPLLWLHGFAEGEKAARIKEVGSREQAWIDFLTVDSEYLGETGMFLYLDVGAGAGARNLFLLDESDTKLALPIDPRYAKSVQYEVTVEWDATYSHPKVAYTKVGR